MDYASFIGLNFIAIMNLGFLIFFIKNNIAVNKKWNKKFFLVTLCNLVVIIVDIIEYVIEFQQFAGQYIVKTYAESICYILNPMMPLMMLFLLNDGKDKSLIATFVGNAIMMIVFATLYLVTKHESYLIMASLLQALVSLLLFAFIIIVIMQRKNNYSKEEKGFILIVAVAIVSSFVIEITTNFRFLVWSVCSLCLVLFYLLIHTKKLKEDILTGFYNRFVFEKDMHDLLNDMNVAVVVFDINRLKIINDAYGHAYGDEHIISISKAITNSFINGKNYRIGGDEFVFISKSVTESQLLKMFDVFNKAVGDMVVSYGYCFSSNEINIIDAFKKADKMMYAKKLESKALENK